MSIGPDSPPTLPAPREANPVDKVLAHRADLRTINRRWNVQVATTLGTWACISIGLGLLLGAGSVPLFGPWLFAFEVAALLSPIVLIVLTVFSRKARAARLALAMQPGQTAAPLTGLTPGLLRFAEQTRVIRLALADASNHDEAIRDLWGWLESLDALAGDDAELARARGVGSGPIGSLFARANEGTPDLSDQDIARCVAHLGHVEALLGIESSAIYR